jgi:hypothetical protein
MLMPHRVPGASGNFSSCMSPTCVRQVLLAPERGYQPGPPTRVQTVGMIDCFAAGRDRA